MKQKMGERLKQSQNTYASLTTFQEVDMSTIMEYRKVTLFLFRNSRNNLLKDTELSLDSCLSSSEPLSMPCLSIP